MAEVLAVGASVIAIIQIADRIIGLCKFYIETARDAPSDLRLILVETSTLKVILENLDFLTACDGPVSKVATCISGADGPIAACLRTVTALEKLFPSGRIQAAGGNLSKRRKMKTALTALAWPLKETKARKLMDEMMRFKSTISLALTTETSHDVKEIRGKALEIHDMLTESQRREVYQWFCHTDPSSLHHQAQKNYEPGTGDWMLRSPEWASWLTGVRRSLWIHGIPGAGKTVLMSYLIEQIKKGCDRNSQQKSICVYYYCYYAHNQDEAKPFLKWVIHILCRRAECVPKYTYALFKNGVEPSLTELFEALAQSLESLETVYIAIDALDESSSDGDLLLVLQTLVADPRFKAIQLIASSRDYNYIEKAMICISSSISMSNPFVEQDIRRYVHSILKANPRFKRWPRDMLKEVEESIATGARGMFRWAVCQIDAIQRLKCERETVHRALETLPKTLNETYDKVLFAVPEEDRLFVEHALRWIAFHNKLYDGEGISYKILVQAAEASVLDVTGNRNERFYDDDMLREVCGCLINISQKADLMERHVSSYTSVGFAHYSVREYLDFHSLGTTLSPRAIGGVLAGHPLKIMLSEAQCIESYDVWGSNVNNKSRSEIDDVLSSEFGIYCLPSALRAFGYFPDQICQQSRLVALAISLLDPSMPHFTKMGKVVFALELRRHTPGRRFGSFFNSFTGDTQWFQDTASEPWHLFILLLLLGPYPESSFLVKKFLEGKDISRLISAPMHFATRLWDVGGDLNKKYTFNDPLVEVIAQVAMSSSIKPLDFLIEISPGLFEPSIVLLLSIGHYDFGWNSQYQTHRPIEQLLELGADPNLRRYRVTPLQIAVNNGDFVGVELLLKAGALVNDAGNPDGIIWGKDAYMKQFSHLHGASPLRICRDFKHPAQPFDQAFGESNQKKIEVLLRQHGAEHFSATSNVNMQDSMIMLREESSTSASQNDYKI